MEYVILVLALLAAIGAGVLFYLDSRQRAAAASATGPADDDSLRVPENEASSSSDEGTSDEDDIEDAEFEELEPVAEAEPAPEVFVGESGPDHASEPEPAAEHAVDATGAQDVPSSAAAQEVSQQDDEEQEVEEPAEHPQRRLQPHRASGLQLPGATRRERRQWADEKGYTFHRRDEYLVDEWTRGAAATGAAARDIVSGWAYQHEMLLMDLGGTNVMAMRTGWNTDQVVDFRRQSLAVEEGSVDLVEVDRVGDFTVFGSDAGVVQRMVDVRVDTALEQMPEAVTAVWIESDWVLAQTMRGSRGDDWDAMLAPLALLADTARVLPPTSEAGMALPLEDFTASRRMPAAPAPTLVGADDNADDGEHDSVDTPPVLRPDEPLELPTRTRPQARGVVAPRAVGGDEVDAIADGTPTQHNPDDTRVLRDLTGGSTIFRTPDAD